MMRHTKESIKGTKLIININASESKLIFEWLQHFLRRSQKIHIENIDIKLAFIGSRWRVKELSYKISRYPSTQRLSKRDVDDEIKKALNVWSKHTDLKFVQKRSGKVHIDVRFEECEHGDGDPFDGSGGTLAHAFFPVFGGDAHFDDDEPWTINSYRGDNLDRYLE